MFIVAGDLMNPVMRQMDPSTLDDRLMACYDKGLWDNHTVDVECLAEASARTSSSRDPLPITPSPSSSPRRSSPRRRNRTEFEGEASA